MLGQAGFRLVHVPGLAVNRARLATRGGQNKSDPRDARAIAEQVRTRNDLRPLRPQGELLVQLRLVAGRRRDLVGEPTRRLVRLHDLAGEQLAAGLVRELAGEALACRTRLAELEADLARLLASSPTPR